MTKKRFQLTAALLLAATVHVGHAAEEVCFPPAERTPFSDVLQCMQDRDDAQQTQIDALKKENQRLTNLVETQRQEKQQLEQKVAELDKQLNRRPSYRYHNYNNGTIHDLKTGLLWLQNANCFGKRKWHEAMQLAANLRSGQCGLRDGSTAGMWRLPTIEEFRTILDMRYQGPALSNNYETAQWKEGNPFSSVQTHGYWSSTEHAGNGGHAWFVYLSLGRVGAFGKASTYYVWPVRRRQ
jgi:hypothetical protein